ncbi:hypothetical protein D3C72_2167110 [compost metagenome]
MIPKPYSSRSPNQKLGIDSSKVAPATTPKSSPLFCFHADNKPNGTAISAAISTDTRTMLALTLKRSRSSGKTA